MTTTATYFYTIYHANNPLATLFPEQSLSLPRREAFTKAYTLECKGKKSLECLFDYCQDDKVSKEVRSLCVGDVIYDHQSKQSYLVLGQGFKRI